VINIEKIT